MLTNLTITRSFGYFIVRYVTGAHSVKMQISDGSVDWNSSKPIKEEITNYILKNL